LLVNAAYLLNVKAEIEGGTFEDLCGIVDIIDKLCADLGIDLEDYDGNADASRV
jgi:hypothetical protein